LIIVVPPSIHALPGGFVTQQKTLVAKVYARNLDKSLFSDRKPFHYNQKGTTQPGVCDVCCVFTALYSVPAARRKNTTNITNPTQPEERR
jgi:hypothetical protein